MGTSENPPANRRGLASALFTPVQARVLGLLFGQPGRRFQSVEVIRLADSGTGAVYRQLQRLAEADLVVVARQGNHKYYQANQESPIFAELRDLVLKTVAVAEPLRHALEPLADRIDCAFFFGSGAKGSGQGGSDLELFVISDEVGYAELYEALPAAEPELARTINPTVYTRAEWKRWRSRKDAFAARIGDRPRIFVVGNDDGRR